MAEFWNFLLFMILILVASIWMLNGAATVLGAMLPEQAEEIMFLIIFMSLLPPFVSVFVRRLHDTGRFALQGFLLLVLPGVGTVILLYLMVRPGLDYETKFGLEPRYDAR